MKKKKKAEEATFSFQHFPFLLAHHKDFTLHLCDELIISTISLTPLKKINNSIGAEVLDYLLQYNGNSVSFSYSYNETQPMF